jgi:hypothetical protein
MDQHGEMAIKRGNLKNPEKNLLQHHFIHHNLI